MKTNPVIIGSCDQVDPGGRQRIQGPAEPGHVLTEVERIEGVGTRVDKVTVQRMHDKGEKKVGASNIGIGGRNLKRKFDDDDPEPKKKMRN